LTLPRLLRVLRHRDFRFLWLAQSASVLGDRIVTIALALFVIDLTGSASDLGLVLAAGALPLIGFLLIGGVWADRLPRHRVMVVTDLARFVLHGVLAGLILSGSVRIWQIVVVEALFGTAEAFSRPASSGLLPQTVPEPEIQEAKAVMSILDNTAEFLGPAIGTALVLGIGAGPAFALDAASFLLSAALLTRVRPRARVAAAHERPRRARLRAELGEGFREVRSRTWVWATLAAFCVALFAGLAPWFVLGPVVAREQYGSIAVFGVVASALGAGTVVGSLVGTRWRPRYPMRVAMLSILLWPGSAILFAAGVTLVLVVPVTALAGTGIALFDVWWETALAERIPPHLLSRVSSYDWMVSLGLLPLGYLVAGPLAEALGPVEVLLGGSTVAILAYLAGLLPRATRTLERRPGTQPDLVGGEPHLGRPLG
jgi:MFS family permease